MIRFAPLLAALMLCLFVADRAPAQSPPPAQTAAQVRAKAIEQVLLSARSQDPFMRANAIEAIQPALERARPLAQLGLKDAHPAVRFAAVVTIGKLRIAGMQGAITNVLKDRDPSVRAGALYAASRLGMNVDISELANLMASRDAGVRSNAAMLLGLLGDRGAVPMMKELGQIPLSRQTSAARQAVYRVQLAEALVQLGEEDALEGIRAGAFSSYDEVRIVSVQAMGRLQDQLMVPALQRIQSNSPIQVQLAAAKALAQLSVTPDVPTVLAAASCSPEDVLTHAQAMARQGIDGRGQAFVQGLLQDPAARAGMAAAIRAEAAFVLGLLTDPASTAKLTSLLDDPKEQVRLSAAAAVLKGRSAGALATP